MPKTTTIRTQVALALVLWAAVSIPSCTGGGNSKGNCSTTCTLAGNRCEFDSSRDLGCVECITNEACQAGAPACVLGACSECGKNSDCATGQVCAPATHQCEAPCTMNANCTQRGASLCDTAGGACVGCLTTTDCPPATPICDATRKQCSQCSSRADCGVAAPACNLQNGQCEECLVDTDCNGSGACGQDHQCHPYCTSNGDCTNPQNQTNFGQGTLCNQDTGACVECFVSTDCTDPARPVCNEQFRCAACTVNADCPASPPICSTIRRNQGGGLGNQTTVCVASETNTDCTNAALPTCDATGICVVGGRSRIQSLKHFGPVISVGCAQFETNVQTALGSFRGTVRP